MSIKILKISNMNIKKNHEMQLLYYFISAKIDSEPFQIDNLKACNY